MNEKIARAIAALDNSDVSRENIDATRAIYAPLHDLLPVNDLTVVRDAKYGPDEAQRLDVVVRDEGGATRRPIFMFVHGGGFVGGSKSTPGTPFYDNVPMWAARHGCVGVNLTYRLAPTHRYPAGAEDVAAAVRWTRENAGKFGGDPDAIVLMGQSAGATHVAAYAARGGRDVAGIVVMSGVYDFPAGVEDGLRPNLEQYAGDGAAALRSASPLRGLVDGGLPTLFTCAELDPAAFHRQAAMLFDAFFAKTKRFPNVHYNVGHNHISAIAHLGARDTGDQALADRLLEFIRTVTKQPVAATP